MCSLSMHEVCVVTHLVNVIYQSIAYIVNECQLLNLHGDFKAFHAGDETGVS